MAEGSLFLDAKRLTAKARVKREEAAGVQADGQFSTALSKIVSQLPELKTQLQNYSVLRAAGIPVGPVPNLARAADKLRTQVADVGRPTPQYLTSRSMDLAATIKAVRTLCDDAWQTWAGDQKVSLVLDPGLVNGIRGQQLMDKLDEIAKESAKPFSQASVSLVNLWVAQAEDLIAQLGSLMTPDDVIARLEAASNSITFADLTQEEIDALRHSPEHARRVRLNVQ